MRINSVPDVKCFVIIKMCYVNNQWYDISCATLYLDLPAQLYLYVCEHIAYKKIY